MVPNISLLLFWEKHRNDAVYLLVNLIKLFVQGNYILIIYILFLKVKKWARKVIIAQNIEHLEHFCTEKDDPWTEFNWEVLYKKLLCHLRKMDTRWTWWDIFMQHFLQKMSSKFHTPDFPPFQFYPPDFKLINCGQCRTTTSGGRERRSSPFLKTEKKYPDFEKKMLYLYSSVGSISRLKYFLRLSKRKNSEFLLQYLPNSFIMEVPIV